MRRGPGRSNVMNVTVPTQMAVGHVVTGAVTQCHSFTLLNFLIETSSIGKPLFQYQIRIKQLKRFTSGQMRFLCDSPPLQTISAIIPRRHSMRMGSIKITRGIGGGHLNWRLHSILAWFVVQNTRVGHSHSFPWWVYIRLLCHVRCRSIRFRVTN